MQNWGKVAVLAGGFSAERNVSLQSGSAVLTALCSEGIDAYVFDPADKPIWRLKTEGFQVAFNVLHGTFGEDGTIQGALSALEIPYTGSGVAASALAMDKFRTRLVWEAFGLPNVPYEVLHDKSSFKAVEERLGLPLFVKPAAEGSSVGVKKIKRREQLKAAYEELKQYHGAILAEKNMTGGEYACTLLNGEALPIIRIVPQTEFYDYEAKYCRNDTEYHCPSGLSAEQEKTMKAMALQAFEALGCYGWGRVDFLYDENGAIHLLEINTLPGMTGHSLAPMAAREIGISFSELCVEILRHARVR